MKDTYKLEEVAWMDPEESRGLHHIFVDVVDRDGHRLAGEKLRVRWSGGEAIIPVEEKPGEPWGGNYAMFATMGSYSVEMVAGAGASDRVAGLGMGTPEEPGVKHHTSFGLRFVLRPGSEPVPESDKPEVVPEEEPVVEPEEPTERPEPTEAEGLVVDSRIKSLLDLDLAGDTYKLEEIVWMDPVESRGLHHIFVDVVDQGGRRLAGEKLRVNWSDGEAIIPVEEKPGEPWGGNYAMYATMGSYSVEMVAGAGASDRVAGLGMGTPEEPGVKHHTSFGLRFRKLGQ
jgi:hypothetical protein